MLIGFLVVVAVLGLALESAYRLVAFALLWTGPILVALAAMQISLSQHPEQPENVFVAFTIAALVTRFVIGSLALAAKERRQ